MSARQHLRQVVEPGEPLGDVVRPVARGLARPGGMASREPIRVEGPLEAEQGPSESQSGTTSRVIRPDRPPGRRSRSALAGTGRNASSRPIFKAVSSW